MLAATRCFDAVARCSARVPLRACRRSVPHSRRHAASVPHSASAGSRGDWDSLALASLESSQESFALGQEAISAAVLARLTIRASPSRGWKSREEAAHAAPVDPTELLERLQANPRDPFPEALVAAIVAQAEVRFAGTPALVDIDVPRGEGARLVVVGDLHGQLQDLLLIFHKHGLPSATNVYLFLGDICDRGPFAVEIWALVLAFALRYPNAITVLRGNHENKTLNSRSSKFGGGFFSECQQKCREFPWMYESFHSIFESLPLFAVVDKQVFMVHGGLFRVPGVTLDRLRALSISRALPAPRLLKAVKEGTPVQWSDDQAIIFDAQWSDPHSGEGIVQSKRGRDCVAFGSDVTESFLKDNNLSFIVRAHEVPLTMHGYAFHHSQRVITVFSASRYGGIMRNRGGVLSLAHPKGGGRLKADLFEHVAPKLEVIASKISVRAAPEEGGRSLPTGSTIAHTSISSRLEEAVAEASESSAESSSESREALLREMVHHIHAILVLHREELWTFCAANCASPGRIFVHSLAVELARLSFASGPDEAGIWMRVLEARFLFAIDSLGLVNYYTLLARFRVVRPMIGLASGHVYNEVFARASMTHLVSSILKQELTPKVAFSVFSKHLNDTADLDECRNVLSRLLPAITPRQVHQIVEVLQMSWGGADEVRPTQFFAALCVDFSPPRVRPESRLQYAIEQIRSKLSPGPVEGHQDDPRSVGEILLNKFLAWDKGGEGLFTHADISHALHSEVDIDLRECGLNTAEAMQEFVSYLDTNGTGTIGIFELLQAFTQTSRRNSRQSASDALSTDLADGIHALLLAHRPSLRRACGVFDEDRSGVLPRKTFLHVVAALFETLREEQAATSRGVMHRMHCVEDVVQEIASNLPTEVPYMELLDGIRVVECGGKTVD